MINLAGKEDCDDYIRKELGRSRINIVESEKVKYEVPYSLTGRLGPFIFMRAWSYWVVNGPMPLEIADELYKDPVGKTDVRSGGDCACRPPETWAEFYDYDGKQLVGDDQEGTQEKVLLHFIKEGYITQEKFDCYRFVPEAGTKRRSEQAPVLRKLSSLAIVNTYHIDSEVGLRIFADIIRKGILNEK